MNQSRLQAILDKHIKWLTHEEGGEIANLCWANLSNADLSVADLSGANLSGANLNDAVTKDVRWGDED